MANAQRSDWMLLASDNIVPAEIINASPGLKGIGTVSRVGLHIVLARRHDHYGLRAEHYASVGAALMWTLERGLGFDFAPDVREAWVTAYNLLSSAMIAASSQPLRGAA